MVILMPVQYLQSLSPDRYEHPFDRRALDSLNNTPGLSRLFKTINEYGLDRLFRFRCMANSIRVSDRNFPNLHRALIQASDVLQVDPCPDLYLSHGEGYIRSFTVGVNQPIVIINVDGLEQLSAAELVFVLGHELGHVKSQHLLYQQAAIMLPVLGKFIASSTLGLGGLATNGLELALYQWVMMAKLTCDRSGLLACQDLDIAFSALIKLAGLPTHRLQANPGAILADFEQQARDFGEYNLDSLDKITKIFSFLENMKPWAILRASELLKWVDSGEYQRLLSGDAGPPPPSSPPTPWAIPTPTPSNDRPDTSPDENQNTSDDPQGEDWDFLKTW